jgi:hypothetical protein
MKRHSAVGSQASYDAMSRKPPSDTADKIGKQLRDVYDAVFMSRFRINSACC